MWPEKDGYRLRRSIAPWSLFDRSPRGGRTNPIMAAIKVFKCAVLAAIIFAGDSLAQNVSAFKPASGGDIFELECLSVCHVQATPHELAPTIRVNGRNWVVQAGGRLRATGYVPRPTGAYGYWRISDGAGTGYLNTPFVVAYRNGQSLNGRGAADKIAEVMRVLSGVIQVERDSIFKTRDFVITAVFPDGPNSAGGVGMRTAYRNLSSAGRIKYIDLSVVAYNAVGDVVVDKVSGASTKSFRVTGPIDPTARAEPDLQAVWGATWYNESITCLRLDRVRIEYLDGTEKTFAGSDQRIRHPEFANSCALM
jgi:hypothetical protein